MSPPPAQVVDGRVGGHQTNKAGDTEAAGHVVLTQLLHVLAQQRHPNVTHQIFQIFGGKHRSVAAQDFEDGLAEQLLLLAVKPFETGGGAPHLGQLVRPRLGDGLAFSRQEPGTKPVAK